jgi:tetratricopeptide (TPR) repeat protein
VRAREGVEAQMPEIRDRYSRAQAAASRYVASAAQAWPTRTPAIREREAVRANADGIRLRHECAYLEVAEQHRIALALFRDLGDRRSEALTLNNLALALDRADDPAALDLFEEAASILGQLGEEEHEGKVIANLGLAFRRRGRDEQSAEVLDVALEKLDPNSQAYRKVERLRRAS